MSMYFLDIAVAVFLGIEECWGVALLFPTLTIRDLIFDLHFTRWYFFRFGWGCPCSWFFCVPLVFCLFWVLVLVLVCWSFHALSFLMRLSLLPKQYCCCCWKILSIYQIDGGDIQIKSNLKTLCWPRDKLIPIYLVQFKEASCLNAVNARKANGLNEDWLASCSSRSPSVPHHRSLHANNKHRCMIPCLWCSGVSGGMPIIA